MAEQTKMAEPPVQEYPKLMWMPDGREATVHSKAEEDTCLGDGWRLTAEPLPAEPAKPAKPDHTLPGGGEHVDNALPESEPEPKRRR